MSECFIFLFVFCGSCLGRGVKATITAAACNFTGRIDVIPTQTCNTNLDTCDVTRLINIGQSLKWYGIVNELRLYSVDQENDICILLLTLAYLLYKDGV